MPTVSLHAGGFPGMVLWLLAATASNLSGAPGTGQPLTLSRGELISVASVSELKTALDAANQAKTLKTLTLGEGTYVLDVPSLELRCPGLVIRSASGNRDAVVVRGPDEGPDAAVGSVFVVSADNVVIADLTVGYCRHHGIQVRGESPFDVSGLRVHNCRLVNCNQQFIKGSSSENDPVGATDGRIEGCLFEFTRGWAYQYYTGGIDIHKGVNWVVRDNLFRNLRVPPGEEGISEHAVHFWKRAGRQQNIVIERNWIVNCDRGIGLGLGEAAGGHQGGASRIRNNMVFNDGTGPRTDVGIGLENASDVCVDNNTVVIQKYWGPVEYRFAGSSNLVFRNNLANQPIQRRDHAPVAVQSGNIERAEAAWFRDFLTGDLRLTGAARQVIDRGKALDEFREDIDGRARPQGYGWDIGASEYAAPFSLREDQGIHWLTKPDGARFFSFGVCVVDQGASRQNLNPTNAGYAAFQHYIDSNAWAAATLSRLKSWNFTTVGGWSDFRALQESGEVDVTFTPVLHVGSTAGVPWWDMWDTNIIARMHQVAREQILPLREDPRLLGYYSDNELGWWNAALFELTLKQAPGSGQRRRLIELLRSTYNDQWPELLKHFEAVEAASFEELDQRGMLYLRPGGNGIRVYRRFLALMAERYYALVKEVIRTWDSSRGLILGDRYQSFYYPEVVRACAPYVDAVSGNLNAAWNDGTFPRFYLDTMRQLSGKPVLVSEFYMAARENRSGNQNRSGTFPTVKTQNQRVDGFRTTLQALARSPYVIGADWFQYYDEPPHGRGDGENFNFGLVDIHNRPYEWLVTAAARLELDTLHAQPWVARLDASSGVPPAPAEPLGHFTVQQALQDWDRERGFVKPVSQNPVADLYICWDPKSIYLGVYAQDIVEREYYRDKTLPESDRAEWVLRIGKDKRVIRARLGPFAPAVCSQSAARLVNVAGIYLNTRNVAAIELPAKLFTRRGFDSGDTIEFEATFFSHARADRVDWKGVFTLRGSQ